MKRGSRSVSNDQKKVKVNVWLFSRHRAIKPKWRYMLHQFGNTERWRRRRKERKKRVRACLPRWDKACGCCCCLLLLTCQSADLFVLNSRDEYLFHLCEFHMRLCRHSLRTFSCTEEVPALLEDDRGGRGDVRVARPRPDQLQVRRHDDDGEDVSMIRRM